MKKLVFGTFSVWLFCASVCAQTPQIVGVKGPFPARDMGLALIHEHVFLDWTGADSIRPARWDNDAAARRILPYLREMQAQGVKTMLECTPNYIGRNPVLLARLADSTGLNIVTNTGYYGAVGDKYVPAHAFRESADQLAARWVAEFEGGIDGTGIRPGFMKIAVDGDSALSAIDEKIVRAAARAHLRTGLTIVSHTGPDEPALRQAEVLEQEGLNLSAWVWTHAQGGTDAVRSALAKKGAWISLDGLGWVDPADLRGDSTALMDYVSALEHLRKEGLLHRVLLSHDAGWYTHDQPGGGRTYKPYTLIFKTLTPLLRKRGFSEGEIRKMLVENPQEAYGVRVRKVRR
jgi:phosphotriesterase-related protein